MTQCNPDIADVIIKFTILTINALKSLGFNLVKTDTVYDTGSMLIYLPILDVYYLTKRNGESVRYDGEIFHYEGYQCTAKTIQSNLPDTILQK